MEKVPAPSAEQPAREAPLPELIEKRAEKLAAVYAAQVARTAERDEFGMDAEARLAYRETHRDDPARIAADERNKLRRNNLTPIIGAIENVLDAIEKTHATGPRIERVREIGGTVPPIETFSNEVYNSMTFEQKAELAQNLDRIAEEILTTLRAAE